MERDRHHLGSWLTSTWMKTADSLPRMNERGYALIDFRYPPSLWPDHDLVVRFMEYVRQNFHTIVPGVPADCELDLIAGGSAHYIGLLPLLGLYAPSDARDQVPDVLHMIKLIDWWCAALPEGEVNPLLWRRTRRHGPNYSGSGCTQHSDATPSPASRERTRRSRD
jgi:hypothetical protein